MKKQIITTGGSQNPDQINLLAVLQPPSVHHWFGTDNLGRDLFSRVLIGTRISVEVAVIILSLSVLFGTALGIVSGLAGGLADEIVMRVTDLFLAFPGFILAADRKEILDLTATAYKGSH